MSGCPHDFTERETAVTADGYCPLCMAVEIERLRALLDAARICFKNRDQSEREATVYNAIRAALGQEDE